MPEAGFRPDCYAAAVGLFLTRVPYNFYSLLSGGIHVFRKLRKFLPAIEPQILRGFLFPRSGLYSSAKIAYL